jgi:hypothetical protein
MQREIDIVALLLTGPPSAAPREAGGPDQIGDRQLDHSGAR